MTTERETRTVGLWLEWGGLQWLLDHAPGHPVAEALQADFSGRLTAFGAPRDLGEEEVLSVLNHEARLTLGLEADPLPPLRGERRTRRGAGRPSRLTK